MDKGFYVSPETFRDIDSIKCAICDWREIGINKIYLLAKDGDGKMTYKSKIAKSKADGEFDSFRKIAARAKESGKFMPGSVAISKVLETAVTISNFTPKPFS